MQGRNVVEKFETSRRDKRRSLRNETTQDRRKRNKTQRGKDHWSEMDQQHEA